MASAPGAWAPDKEQTKLNGENMEITTETVSGYCVIRVSGRLDAVTAPDLEGVVTETIEKGEHRLALELSGLEYISSAGLRIFLIAAKKLKGLEGELSLAGQKDSVKEVIEISGFSSIMSCYDSLEELPPV